MRAIASLFTAALTAVGCAAAGATTDLRALHAAGAPLLDVRTPQEWRDDGHVASSVLIPVQEFEARLAEVNKLVGGDLNKPIVVVCRSGGRAEQARKMLAARGYTAVFNGGAWTNLR